MMDASHAYYRAGLWAVILISITSGLGQAEDPWVVYEGCGGPGGEKHIVLISGDEEYRSEELLPQLGRILSTHHGFRCTVLFAIDPDSGEIDPNNQNNIPGLEALDDADLMILFTRFRDLPDDQMRHIVDYVESGRPIIGMRTATHAFLIPDGNTYSRYSFERSDRDIGSDRPKNVDWDGGFGRQVLGETWVSHHGHHGHESTRGIIVGGERDHPILRGIDEGSIYGPTDVYTVRLPLPETCRPIVLGQVLRGMSLDDPPVDGSKNDPMMPIAWTNNYATTSGNESRVFCTTMGAARDFLSEGVRRLMVNATYWCLGIDENLSNRACVDIVGDYDPRPFGTNRFRKGTRPSAYGKRVLR